MNKRLLDALTQYGVMKWQLAEMMGICPQTFSVRMRKQWSDEDIDAAIELIKKNKGVM